MKYLRIWLKMGEIFHIQLNTTSLELFVVSNFFIFNILFFAAAWLRIIFFTCYARNKVFFNIGLIYHLFVQKILGKHKKYFRQETCYSNSIQLGLLRLTCESKKANHLQQNLLRYFELWYPNKPASPSSLSWFE